MKTPLVRPRVGVCVPLALSSSFKTNLKSTGVARSGLWAPDKIKYSESEAGARIGLACLAKPTLSFQTPATQARIGPDGVTRGAIGVVCTRARAQLVTGDPTGSERGRFRRCGILPPSNPIRVQIYHPVGC